MVTSDLMGCCDLETCRWVALSSVVFYCMSLKGIRVYVLLCKVTLVYPYSWIHSIFPLQEWKIQAMFFPLVTSDLMGCYGLEIYLYLVHFLDLFSHLSTSVHDGMNYALILGYDVVQRDIQVCRVFP